MAVPRSDPLRSREQSAKLPSRGVRGVKLAEDQLDADKIKGTDVSVTPPAEGETLVMRDGVLTPEAIPGASHELLSATHLSALRVTAGIGLNASYAAGQARIDQAVYSIAAGSIALTGSATNRVYVNSGGAVAVTTGAYPSNSIPLARVVTNISGITQITDDRCLFYEDTAAGGGGGTDHAALTNLAYASAAHTGFETPTGAQAKVDTHAALADPHTVYGALAQAETWAALQTFSAGLKLAASQQVQDSGGTGRILLATATPHLTLTGDLRVSGGMVGIHAAPLADRRLKVVESGTPAAGIAIAEFTTSGLTLNTGIGLTALIGVPLVSVAAAATATYLTALNFSFGASGGTGGGTMSAARGIDIRSFFPTWSGTLTELTGIYLTNQAISGAGSVTLATGIYIANWGNDSQVVDVYCLRIDDPTLNTGFRRLIEAGPATPNLRLEGNSPTVSGDSKLLLTFYDGAAIGLRRILMGAANSGGAGFRQVLVAN